jgi:hypothetical protein
VAGNRLSRHIVGGHRDPGMIPVAVHPSDLAALFSGCRIFRRPSPALYATKVLAPPSPKTELDARARSAPGQRSMERNLMSDGTAITDRERRSLIANSSGAAARSPERAAASGESDPMTVAPVAQHGTPAN